MLYQSTRGDATPVQAAEAIKLGIAPDGGLFVPIGLPSLDHDHLQQMENFSYAARAALVIAPFLTEYTLGELEREAQAAYGPDRFDHPAVTPLASLGERTYLLELWHGPTAAFKDLALQLMPRLLTAAIAKTGEQREIVILVATSGDTGKAALEGFRDVPGTRIIVFYPSEGVSLAQKLQMLTQEGGNVAVVGVDGNFDDAQTGVKEIFGDQEFAADLARSNRQFSSANSINWGRLVPQIAYYVAAYVQLVRDGAIQSGERVNVAVPTGNFGNILSAYYAKSMGLPIARLICASNCNNVLTDFINTGVYDRRRTFYPTVSPSMDILISSNLERLLFLLANQDAEQVREWMLSLRQSGRYRLEPQFHRRLQADFWGGFAGEEQTRAAIGRTWHDQNYLLDTHTAVGLHVLEEYRRATDDRTPAILAATASPFKFSAAVMQALTGRPLTGQDELRLLEELAQLTGQRIPSGLRDLDRKPVRHDRRCAPAGMRTQVREILGMS